MVVTALDPAAYEDLVRRALAEDVGAGDVTTQATVPAGVRGAGILLAKSRLVVAGLDVAQAVFREVAGDPAPGFDRRAAEGEWVDPGTELASVDGLAAALLTAERTALNLLQRMCGIATATRQFVDAAAGRLTILDTRKTTPTMRAIEKYAVRVGGATNHRFGLYDQVLIKDNNVRRDCPCDCRSAPAHTGLDGRDRSPDSCRSHRSGGRGCGHHPPRQPDDA